MTKKEAIERIKARFDKWALDNEDMKAIQSLIPELKESEDERMINKLIAHFKWDGNTRFTKEECDEAIAWLEKQKEQPTNEEMLRTLRAEYEKGVADTIAKYEQKEQKSVDSMALSEDGFTPKDVFRFNLASCLYNYGKTVAAKCLGTHILDEELNDYVTNDDVDKSVEKSIELLRENACEQKPAEWSEEDESNIQVIECALYDSKTISHDDYLRVMDWFKSLRTKPHWKPSEEEMEALSNATALNEEQGAALYSLFYHLQKLL